MQMPLSQLAEQLDQTLAQAGLNAEAKRWGRALLDRLRAPVQIMVMGPRGAGKSTLINTLVGAPVVPDQAAVPVIEILGGAEDGLQYERADGSSGTCNDIAVCPGDSLRLTRSVPVPTLEDCSFAEINLDPGSATSEAVMEWALERADIVLWCSSEFGATERAIWAKVPEILKDHSFLVLTHADRQIADGVLTSRIEALAAIVEEEFLSLFPIAARHAAEARSAHDWETANAWKSSGGKALHDAVYKRVEHGRLADQDSARLFLSRFAGLRQTVSDSAHTVPAGRTAPQRATARVAGGVFDEAQALLQKHADSMLASLRNSAGVAPETVLDDCVLAAEGLASLLAEAEAADAATCALRDDAAESAEMMLLFQLERTEDAAADAVTLLLQLKREVAEHAFG